MKRTHHRCFHVAAVLLGGALASGALAGCGADESLQASPEETQSAIVGGTIEPDYRFPWVVRLNGHACGGVLIAPQWVLTAAHCVIPENHVSGVSYTRTDPRTGLVKTETRLCDPNSGPSNNRGIFIHPYYAPLPFQDNDIALIKLASPFAIAPMMQVVGLPWLSRSPGVVGALASGSHTTTLPAGQIAVFRAPIPTDGTASKFSIFATTAKASLCPGDSGSGFVTVEGGRAMVRGVASQANTSNCSTPNGEAVFTDVFNYRSWILQTMGMSDLGLAGNTRLRWSGKSALGLMDVRCSYKLAWLTVSVTPRTGPLNVAGVEEGITCPAGSTIDVGCLVDANQPGTTIINRPVLSSLLIQTVWPNNYTERQTVYASTNDFHYRTTYPQGAVYRQFTCQIGTAYTSGGGGTVGSFSP